MTSAPSAVSTAAPLTCGSTRPQAQAVLAPALNVTEVFDSLAVLVNVMEASKTGELSTLWKFTDNGETACRCSNGTLIYYPDPKDTTAELTLIFSRTNLPAVLNANGSLPKNVRHHGEPGVLKRLLALLHKPEPARFAIVTP
ncbi:alkyl sulfatase C-terminal domain-containing protein [Streptomyces scopuliridis]|uniref:alkyl sulfatase C-terminal domain-containing protein n=1 Tax=Streptomyces scopuliridis TaxID=452529 RepID=UPI0036BA8AEF